MCLNLITETMGKRKKWRRNHETEEIRGSLEALSASDANMPDADGHQGSHFPLNECKVNSGAKTSMLPVN